MQAKFYYSNCKCGNCVPGCKCVKMVQSYIQCSGFGPPCSQLSYLGSLVGKSATWKADGHGFESHTRQPIFLSKTTVSGELCCVPSKTPTPKPSIVHEQSLQEVLRKARQQHNREALV